MNKFFNFFNKIMGFVVFITALILIVGFCIHHSHYGSRHFRRFPGGHKKWDSTMQATRDSAVKK